MFTQSYAGKVSFDGDRPFAASHIAIGTNRIAAEFGGEDSTWGSVRGSFAIERDHARAPWRGMTATFSYSLSPGRNAYQSKGPRLQAIAVDEADAQRPLVSAQWIEGSEVTIFEAEFYPAADAEAPCGRDQPRSRTAKKTTKPRILRSAARAQRR